jgi:hypothetical protein
MLTLVTLDEVVARVLAVAVLILHIDNLILVLPVFELVTNEEADWVVGHVAPLLI